jgi:hypothetical protein
VPRQALSPSSPPSPKISAANFLAREYYPALEAVGLPRVPTASAYRSVALTLLIAGQLIMTPTRVWLRLLRLSLPDIHRHFRTTPRPRWHFSIANAL